MTYPNGAQQGIGKLEFFLLIAMIGVLFSALMERLIGMEVETERAEVRLTERNMRVGLSLAVGERLMRGREDHLPELLDANPVSFLGHLPRGYLPDAGTADGPGNWRFDPASRILYYRPRQPEAFDGRTALRWRIAWQVSPAGKITGIRLESLAD